MNMSRAVLLAASTLVFFAGLISALTSVPTCPANQVCIFSGLSLEPVKEGPTGKDFSTAGFSCPVNAPVTGGFSQAYTNLNGEKRVRQGVEIRVPEGTPVKAAAAGTVTEARTDQLGAGIYVTVRHSSNPLVTTTYGFLQHASKREGDSVRAGEVVGTSGKSGSAKEPAVYFELRRGGLAQRSVEDICRNAPVQATLPPSIQPTPSKTVASICPKYDALFAKYIAKHKAESILSPAIVGGVAYTESGCNPNPSNGQGMMQVVRCESRGCTLEQNIDLGVGELVQNFKNIQAKGISNAKEAWTLVFFGYNRGVGTVDKAIAANKQGTPLRQAMVQACYYYYDKGAYGGCGGFGREACCNSPGLGAQYPDRIFINIPATARPA